jgi:hypothetical protein
MRIRYANKTFQPKTKKVIDDAIAICQTYSGSLTLRQLYYQFVARDLLPNEQRSYNRLQNIISDARMAGEFDWDYIIDRTRNLVARPTWESPAKLLEAAAAQYQTDLWGPQKRRVEVWIEKDAAIGTVEQVCQLNQVPYFSCRGYTSSSEMWSAANRIGEYLRNGEQTVILHIGDHDPSGWDMSRDIEDRLRTFIHQDWANEFMGFGSHTRGAIRQSMRQVMWDKGSDIGDAQIPWEVRRIALTLEQVEQYNPPPNPAKTSDDRYDRYVEETGCTESWELDALDPNVMEQLIQDNIDGFRNDAALATAERKQEEDRLVLTNISNRWDDVKGAYGG